MFSEVSIRTNRSRWRRLAACTVFTRRRFGAGWYGLPSRLDQSVRRQVSECETGSLPKSTSASSPRVSSRPELEEPRNQRENSQSRCVGDQAPQRERSGQSRHEPTTPTAKPSSTARNSQMRSHPARTASSGRADTRDAHRGVGSGGSGEGSATSVTFGRARTAGSNAVTHPRPTVSVESRRITLSQEQMVAVTI